MRLHPEPGVELEAKLAVPKGQSTSPVVLLLHGFPSGDVWATDIGSDMTELGERLCQQMGWTVLTVRFRGCGSSTGNFSLAGWSADGREALRYLYDELGAKRVWVAGFGTGGAIGLDISVSEPRVMGTAILGTPADFDDWDSAPTRLLAHAHKVGAIRDPTFPEDLDEWASQLKRFRATSSAEALEGRPLLVLHGSADDVVPQVDARMVAEAHGSADLRLVPTAGHGLRYDPRAIAILLGWLERNQHSA